MSQHLDILEDVGLVTHQRVGTRHLYELNGHGVVVLRAWVEGFWDEALTVSVGEVVAEDADRTLLERIARLVATRAEGRAAAAKTPPELTTAARGAIVSDLMMLARS